MVQVAGLVGLGLSPGNPAGERMVRQTLSLVCSIAALIGIMMTEMPTSVKIILAVILVLFVIFTLSAGSGKRDKDDRPSIEK
jgi:hypothetical protein